MKTIKLGVAMDEDGHFMVANISDRKKTLCLLQKIHGGDYWANSDTDEFEDFHEMTDDNWVAFLWHMTQRGTFEIVDASALV